MADFIVPRTKQRTPLPCEFSLGCVRYTLEVQFDDILTDWSKGHS